MHFGRRLGLFLWLLVLASRRTIAADAMVWPAGSHTESTRALGEEAFPILKPGRLVNHKAASQVVSPKSVYKRITIAQWDVDNVYTLIPPLEGLLPGILGVVAIYWGWWNIVRRRKVTASSLSLLCGCVLWTYCCFALRFWRESH